MRRRKQSFRCRLSVIAASVLLALSTLDPNAEPTRGTKGAVAKRGEETLAAEDAERLFVPGSVLKLVVSAAALHFLGGDHRLVTELAAAGEIHDGVLDGDLIWRAGGDPTWNRRFFPDDSRQPLRQLARQLKAAGVRRVSGDLMVDRSRFPGRPYPASRPISEAAFAYAAPTSALALDENAIALEIAPGPRRGVPGSVRGDDDWIFINQIRTVGKERHDKGTVECVPFWDSRTVLVRGEYPLSEPPYRIALSVPQPDRWAAETLRAILSQESIVVTGRIRLADEPIVAPLSLARLESPPIADLLTPILSDSHNWYAEMLLLALATEVSGEGRLDTGLEIEKRFLEEVVGIVPGSFVLDDASGLSPYNLLTPDAVVSLLAWVWRQPWRDIFVDAMASAERGTLAAWPTLPAVRAKSGTIRHTLALAGYAFSSSQAAALVDPRRRDSVQPVIFSVFLNNRSDERPGLRAEIASWLRRLPFAVR